MRGNMIIGQFMKGAVLNNINPSTWSNRIIKYSVNGTIPAASLHLCTRITAIYIMIHIVNKVVLVNIVSKLPKSVQMVSQFLTTSPAWYIYVAFIMLPALVFATSYIIQNCYTEKIENEREIDIKLRGNKDGENSDIALNAQMIEYTPTFNENFTKVFPISISQREVLSEYKEESEYKVFWPALPCALSACIYVVILYYSKNLDNSVSVLIFDILFISLIIVEGYFLYMEYKCSKIDNVDDYVKTSGEHTRTFIHALIPLYSIISRLNNSRVMSVRKNPVSNGNGSGDIVSNAVNTALEHKNVSCIVENVKDTLENVNTMSKKLADMYEKAIDMARKALLVPSVISSKIQEVADAGVSKTRAVVTDKVIDIKQAQSFLERKKWMPRWVHNFMPKLCSFENDDPIIGTAEIAVENESEDQEKFYDTQEEFYNESEDQEKFYDAQEKFYKESIAIRMQKKMIDMIVPSGIHNFMPKLCSFEDDNPIVEDAEPPEADGPPAGAAVPMVRAAEIVVENEHDAQIDSPIQDKQQEQKKWQESMNGSASEFIRKLRRSEGLTLNGEKKTLEDFGGKVRILWNNGSTTTIVLEGECTVPSTEIENIVFDDKSTQSAWQASIRKASWVERCYEKFMEAIRRI